MHKYKSRLNTDTQARRDDTANELSLMQKQTG